MEKAKRPQHSDQTNYVAWVLWLIGFSEKNIAVSLMAVDKLIRRKQIAGIIGRSPYANRSAMSDQQRQQALDELVAARFDEDGKPTDGGILDRIPMKIIKLRPSQLKKKAS